MPDFVWIFLTILALLLTAGLGIIGIGRWRLSWVAVLLAFAMGLLVADQPRSAIMRWIGLAALIMAVGPVMLSPAALAARSVAWTLTVNGLPILTGIFVAWYALHLPSFGGAVYFTSFMNQSMLLGPVAGLGAVIALARAVHGRSWRWGLLAVFGLIPVLASGSRLAFLATGSAACFLLVRRKPVIGIAMAVALGLGVYGFIHFADTSKASDSFAGALVKKGTENSRTDLWQCRIDEFRSSPIIGIGVGMGTGSGGDEDAGGNIRVEPGSSYLAILAMTGGVGFIAFFSALALLVYEFAVSKRSRCLDADILSLSGIFLAVHGVAEGWILGFGSPLCFLFWLWLGNFGDAALQPAQSQAVPRSVPLRRVRSGLRSLRFAR